MKKFSLLLTLAIMMVGSTVFAGSIDYLSNQSAKYLTTFHRTASTDASADIANYNPAGTALLAPGLYLDLSSQTLLKYYETDTSDSRAQTGVGVYTKLSALGQGFKDKYEQSEPTLILPNFYAVYNFGQMGPGKLAAYAQLGVSAGGGALKWDDGTAATFGALSGIFKTAGGTGAVTDQSFEASSVYYTINAGAAYAFLDDMVSVSVGGKAIIAKRTMKVSGTDGTRSIDGEFDYDATGYTAVIGLDVKPIKDLTLAARYEMETDLEFDYDQKKLNASSALVTTIATSVLGMSGVSDGQKANNNLPAILSLGAEYKVTPELAVMASSNIYFLSQADMGKTNIKNAAGTAVVAVKDTNEYFGTGYEFGLGATYLIMPELKAGLGFMYTESGAKDAYFNNQDTFLNCAGNPPLDSYTIGLGGTYTVIQNLDVTLSGSWTHYLPETYKIGDATTAPGQKEIAGEYKKDVYNIGLGVGYKM